MPIRPKILLTAVLLAGGESRRMGRDKAGVELNGVPLWKHQLRLLQSLDLEEYVISGRSDGPYAEAGVPIIPDVLSGCGPLAGIVTTLEASKLEGILVLAVDTPFVPVEFLIKLRDRAASALRSVIPQIGNAFEPLVAVYLKDALCVARTRLAAGDLKLQDLAESLIAKDLAIAHPVPFEQRGYFRNLNTPGDLATS
jgi:molybdopterin-guanine dinucleotide biosynthesis protein A